MSLFLSPIHNILNKEGGSGTSMSDSFCVLMSPTHCYRKHPNLLIWLGMSKTHFEKYLLALSKGYGLRL